MIVATNISQLVDLFDLLDDGQSRDDRKENRGEEPLNSQKVNFWESRGGGIMDDNVW